MFKPSASLLPTVPHLYTATSFRTPAMLAAPTVPDDWVSYNAVDPNGPPSFEAFKSSPAFKTVQNQLLDRIAQCDRFAGEHFSAREAEQIRSGLTTFRQHLLEHDGVSFFNVALPKLYGSGKRYFDHFCLQLEQGDIDLHQRKAVLRELAADLHFCRSSEAAFRTASAALSRKPGGLHAEFHDLLLQRINALLLELVRRDPEGPPLTQAARADREEYLESMEVHAVNRLKMELDLPGAEMDDRYTCDRVVTPRLIQQAQELLRTELHPSVLARDLAERYMHQLRELLPAEARSPTADLSDSMGVIGEANTQMGATFGAVPLNHLLVFDDDTDKTLWQNDVTLLAMDLLKSLEAQDLVVRQEPGLLLNGYTPPRHWDLLHVDWRLFLVNERDHLQATPALAPIQIHHALALAHRMPRLLPLHGLTDALLASGRPDNLAKLPAHWLEDEAQCLRHCKALGDDGLKDWLTSAGPLPQLQKRMLTRAMTQLDQLQSLKALIASDDQVSPRQWIEWAGGFDVLRQLLIHQPEAKVLPYWAELMEPFLYLQSPNEFPKIFGQDLQTSLVPLAMKSAPLPLLKTILRMAITAREAEALSNDAFLQAMRTPIQDLMREGRQEAFEEYLDKLDLVCCGGWLSSAQLAELLEGPVRGAGCRGAIQAGRVAMIDAFHSTVRIAQSQGHLDKERAFHMIIGASRNLDPGGWEAIANRQPDALAAHLRQVQLAVITNVIPSFAMRHALRCESNGGRSGLQRMLMDTDGRHPCLDPWIQAVVEAYRAKLISAPEASRLLQAGDYSGPPVLHSILDQPHPSEAAVTWLSLVQQLRAEDVLPDCEIIPVLESSWCVPQATVTAMTAAMRGLFSKNAIQHLLGLYGLAHQWGLVSRPDLMTLLRAEITQAQRPPVLIMAIRDERIWELIEYLVGIEKLAEGLSLDEAALQDLLDVSNPKKESALTLAMINRELPAVKAFLESTLALAEQGRLSGDAWCELMMPFQHGRPIYELRSCESHDLLRLFEGAMQRAERGGLLGGKVGRDLDLLWQQFRMALPELQQAVPENEALEPPVRLTAAQAAGRAALARAATAAPPQPSAPPASAAPRRAQAPADPPPPAPHRPQRAGIVLPGLPFRIAPFGWGAQRSPQRPRGPEAAPPRAPQRPAPAPLAAAGVGVGVGVGAGDSAVPPPLPARPRPAPPPQARPPLPPRRQP